MHLGGAEGGTQTLPLSMKQARHFDNILVVLRQFSEKSVSYPFVLKR